MSCKETSRLAALELISFSILMTHETLPLGPRMLTSAQPMHQQVQGSRLGEKGFSSVSLFEPVHYSFAMLILRKQVGQQGKIHPLPFQVAVKDCCVIVEGTYGNTLSYPRFNTVESDELRRDTRGKNFYFDTTACSTHQSSTQRYLTVYGSS